MKHESIQIKAKSNPLLSLNATPGHFATNHSHINYYVDITQIKHSHSMAWEAARTMAAHYKNNTLINTIICMDGTDVIGGYLAHDLVREDFHSLNSQNEINIIMPEYNTNGQMIFRDNIEPMIYNKHILLLIASVTTGKTINRSLECIQYYGGIVAGVTAIFSAISEYAGNSIYSLFTADDVPGYNTYPYKDCPDCKNHRKIDAIVNSFGYSSLR